MKKIINISDGTQKGKTTHILKETETCTEFVQPKGHFPMRKYAKVITESERLQDELEPIYD